jgi:PTS system galactitol-specific IIA component
VDVSIIFMLAVKHANDHLEMLQKLIDLFQDKIVVSNLANCKNQKDLNRLLTSVLVK